MARGPQAGAIDNFSSLLFWEAFAMSTFTRWSGPAAVALALGLVLALACSSTEAAPLQASFDFEDLP